MSEKNDLTIEEMSDRYFDVLREIGNIGAGNATTALSTMLGARIDMMVPKVKLMEFKEVGTTLGGEEQLVAGIYLEVNGDIHGSIMFIQKKESARAMVQIANAWPFSLRIGLPITHAKHAARHIPNGIASQGDSLKY